MVLCIYDMSRAGLGFMVPHLWLALGFKSTGTDVVCIQSIWLWVTWHIWC